MLHPSSSHLHKLWERPERTPRLVLPGGRAEVQQAWLCTPSPKWGCLPHCVLVALARPVQSPSQPPCSPRPHQRRPLIHTPGSTSWAWLSFARCLEGRGGRNRLSLWPSSLVMSIPSLITSLISCLHPAPPIRHRHNPGRPSHLPSLPHLDQLCYQGPHPPPPQEASSGCLEWILKVLSTPMLWLNVT